MADGNDERWMRQAITLSRRGFPAPNPHVGCVIVRDEQVLAEGFHAYAGGPHAEVAALEKLGGRAHGATAYVTLEPCNHQGRTGACSEALIRAGVTRVVAASADPNPVATGGAGRLREAGIDVQVGCLAVEAARANERFLTAMRLGRPFVLAKAAVTLDGFLARADGSSKWITGPAARRCGHRLRAEMGAVLVGRGTVEADDPLLTARIPGVTNQPFRFVLDPERRLGEAFQVFTGDDPAARVVAADRALPGDVAVARGNSGLDLQAMLRDLFRRGITGLLVEGGAATLASFLQGGWVDGLELFVAPVTFGTGVVWSGGAEVGSGLALARSRRVGPDLWLSYRRQGLSGLA